RLRTGLGAPITRATYLRVLTPFFGFLHLNKWDCDAEPPLVGEYTRACLRAVSCVLRRDRERDGFIVAVTATAPLSRAHRGYRAAEISPGPRRGCFQRTSWPGYASASGYRARPGRSSKRSARHHPPDARAARRGTSRCGIRAAKWGSRSRRRATA